MIIANHPKMIAMWASRCKEERKRLDLPTFKQWITKMFTKEQMELINHHIYKSKQGMKNNEGRT